MNPIKDEWRSDDGSVRLILGDCLEVLPTLSGIDAVVTDQPYGVGFAYESFDDKLSPEQWEEWMRPRFREFRRVAATVLITGQARLPQLARIEPWDWLLQWWKPAAMGRSPVGVNNWEPIAVWGKMPKAKVNDVIRACIVPDRSVEGHPCPKPLQWAVGQLELWPEASQVADPFAGSGTTGVACVRTGRRFVGIEIERKYWEIAVRRVRAELERFPLFESVAKPRQLQLLDAGAVSVPSA